MSPFQLSGQVAFADGLAGGTSAAGLFLGTLSSPQAVALVGQPAPGGGNYTTTFTAPVLNANAQLGFVSLVGSAQALFAGPSAALQQVAISGTLAPGGLGNYSSFITNTISINAAGSLEFASTLSGGSSTSGLFAGTPSSVQALVLNGQTAPGGGTFTTFSGNTINSAGQVTFTGNITGGTSSSGLFQGTPGSVKTLVLQGSADPDTSGATIAAITSSAVPNGMGQVAFTVSLAGTGVVSTVNDTALFAYSNGSLNELVRRGDVIDVDPSPAVDYRTVSAISLLIGSGGQDGKGVAINDSGIVDYRLTFTDGSSGIFTSSAVPEPTSLGLVCAGAAMLMRRKRKQSAKLV